MLVVLGGWGAWLGADALRAKRETGAAVDLVATMQQEAVAGDHDDVGSRLDDVRRHAAAAREATQGPHWSAARFLPWLGNDIAVVQTGAEIVEALAADVLPDLAEVVAAVEPAALVPQDGRVDLQPLIDAQPLVVAAAHRVDAARGLLGGMPERVVLPEVANARDELAAELDDLATMLGTASRAVQLLPAMLGAEGERRYLVLLQNPAEPRATGGVPVPVQVLADDGVVTVDLAASAGVEDITDLVLPPAGAGRPEDGRSTGDSPRDELPLDELPLDELPLDELPLDQLPLDELPLDELPLDGRDLGDLDVGDLDLGELLRGNAASAEPRAEDRPDAELTSTAASSAGPDLALPVSPLTDVLLSSRLADAMLTPDFPRAAQLAQAAWEEHTGETVDGVLAIEPGTLGLVLAVTGPVTTADGTELTAENVAEVLMNEVYLEGRGEKQADIAAVLATMAVFDAVVAAGWEPQAMVDAVTDASREGRVAVWSAHESEQQLLTGTRMSGEVRGRAGDSPVIGVYVNDEAESKIGYYLGMDVRATSTACLDDGAQQVTVRVQLTSSAPPDAADLPEVISGGEVLPAGQIGGRLLLYAPRGGIVESVDVTGMNPGVQPQLHDGLIVVGKGFSLDPGEEATIEYVVRTGARQPGTPVLRTTPLAQRSVHAAGGNCG